MLRNEYDSWSQKILLWVSCEIWSKKVNSLSHLTISEGLVLGLSKNLWMNLEVGIFSCFVCCIKCWSLKPSRGYGWSLARAPHVFWQSIGRVKDVPFLWTSGSSFFLCVGNQTPFWSRTYVWPGHTHIARDQLVNEMQDSHGCMRCIHHRWCWCLHCSLYGEIHFGRFAEAIF